MILFLVFFPLSFFFGSLYTESVFFFFCLSSFYAARKKNWRIASIFACLASATRLTGIFLLPALLWEQYKDQLIAQSLELKNKAKNSNFNANFKSSFQLLHCYIVTLLHSPIIYISPLGLIFYMIYLQLQFGDFLYFWHAQPIFGAERSGTAIILLPQVIWRYLKIFASVSIYTEAFWIPVIEFISSLGAIYLLILSHMKKVRLSYLIFSWLTVIVPTLTGTFSSMPRYIILAFPIYIVLGLLDNKIVRYLLLITCYLLLIALTILFTRGHWVS
ncbi:hypothetical protein A2Y99_03955 [Candidatus Gottesmanbacteria bacterium RBG_13_37_7]|uniref:Glycosyltransferase RgtA/B/C/D-like domain-containing protein n=1 Tax=Candidatus Gottesmanbacteria bacterium RBG_13_37_7 TaxID=1798369 RepID=A0A1F5YIM6_9BACT|nr:MAG: hypothetical protein A2Y99_03955 [Candidatus Gottesmanbacteria bacterium RBG_13_37_7]